MFPSIPAFRPFGHVACPAGAQCELLNCIFSHEKAPGDEEQREAKPMKLENEPMKQPVHREEAPGRTTQTVFVGSIGAKGNTPAPNKETTNHKQVPTKTPVTETNGRHTLPLSATRPVSPPKTAAKKLQKIDPPVVLRPAKLVKEPATFTRRAALLKVLRDWMGTLNEKVSQSSEAHIKALALSENQLNKLAVDEEEKYGLKNVAVYENVLSRRIGALKKMTLDDWVKERKSAEEAQNGTKPASKPVKTVETGMSAKAEVLFLSRILTPLGEQEAHGYVTIMPTEEEVTESRSALALADHWEVCDRCATRFQVFPDRREEDGALTTGGKCQHHWGRKAYGKKTKSQVAPETTWTCCSEPLGSPGCTTSDTHVFKISGSDKKRLSAIMPFIVTPENEAAEPYTAVCFDCEMGYTTYGLEMMRITAVSWPSHKPIFDVLVRPLGHILDLNTRFSGITPEKFFNAKQYDPKEKSVDPKDLRIVESPYAARDLLLSFISPTTPLVGHALENDLNVIRLIHPTTVDTVFLYPHKGGLPYRHALRYLAKQHLDKDIQQGGASGHDSYEDAWATGELVRLKVAEEWRKLKREGWTLENDEVYPPRPSEPPPPPLPIPPPPPPPPPPAEAVPGSKRKLGEDKDNGDTTGGTEEPPSKKQK
jgi:DNA polymerase III epsilon subunit-like protein